MTMNAAGKSTRLLVTRLSGMLGRALVQAGRDRLSVSAQWHTHPLVPDGFEGASVDLTQDGEAAALMRHVKAQWVVHCAAMTDVDQCEQDPSELSK